LIEGLLTGPHFHRVARYLWLHVHFTSHSSYVWQVPNAPLKPRFVTSLYLSILHTIVQRPRNPQTVQQHQSPFNCIVFCSKELHLPHPSVTSAHPTTQPLKNLHHVTLYTPPRQPTNQPYGTPWVWGKVLHYLPTYLPTLVEIEMELASQPTVSFWAFPAQLFVP